MIDESGAIYPFMEREGKIPIVDKLKTIAKYLKSYEKEELKRIHIDSVSNLQTEYNKLQKELSRKTEENDQLKKRNDELEKKDEELEKVRRELTECCTKKQNELERKEEEIQKQNELEKKEEEIQSVKSNALTWKSLIGSFFGGVIVTIISIIYMIR